MTLWPGTPEADRVPISRYEEAVTLTGIDLTTLQHYAYVARHVPRELRNEHISWERTAQRASSKRGAHPA